MSKLSGDWLLLQVWNEGNPIAPENIAKIFAPFWRNTTSSQREGLGLGLHICSQIIAAHTNRRNACLCRLKITR
jgi:signal transduction histidine kinase